MKKILLNSILTSLLILLGCSTYKLTKESLISQLEENQIIAVNEYFQKFSLKEYPSNNLQRIKCIDKDNNKIWLYPDKNTQIVITRKSDGQSYNCYFDTVIFLNDTLYGLRSRLIGGLRKIPINDIKSIHIEAEFPKVEMILK